MPLKQILVRTEGVASPDSHCPYHSIVDGNSTHLTLNLVEFPHITGLPEFCAHGALQTRYVYKGAWNRAYMLCVYPLCLCACSVVPSDFTQGQRSNHYGFQDGNSRASNPAGAAHGCSWPCVLHSVFVGLCRLQSPHPFCSLFTVLPGMAWHSGQKREEVWSAHPTSFLSASFTKRPNRTF